MPAMKIVDGLQEVSDMRAEVAAREGFLEWVFTLPTGASPARAARDALDEVPGGCRHSRAAKAFLVMLTEVALDRVVSPVRRGGRAGRRLQ